ncbi:MAG: MotA/TolQ/ExbB proton channel family protein [Planctomycetota bacterium]
MPLLAQAAPRQITLTELLDAGGIVGYAILALSVVMVAIAAQRLLATRRSRFVPDGLGAELHRLIGEGEYAAAEAVCRQRPCLMSEIVRAGLAEVSLGYAAVEKAMEDRAAAESARLDRQIDALSTIGTVAPMLGLMGTVWGMILAFIEFESSADPEVAQLAPGIYRALVTTLLGLGVAVPALSLYAWLRNRSEELVHDAALTAERVFANYKRAAAPPARRDPRAATLPMSSVTRKPERRG